MAPASTVDRLSVRVPGALSSDERAAWGRRAARALREVNLDPAGLPPAAILVVRRLTDLLPRALFVCEPWQAAGPWGEAARSSLAQQWRSAGRPFRNPVRSEASAVWFADPAEWLACLSLDLRRTQAAERWWWRSWLTQGPAAGGLASLWTAEARWLPAALVLLDQRQADEAAEVVEVLSEAEASDVRRAVVQAHRLPPRLADTHLDLDRCRALLSGRRLALPPRRAPAELLALALLIGAAPALAHDPRLIVELVMDATGHGEQPPDLYLPPARTPTPEASSSDWAATRHATRSPERVVLAPVLDAAPAHAHDPLVGAGELRAASADHVSGQAACDIRPSPSHPTDQPSDDLPVQFEDSKRWPAPVTPATLREGARQASSRADRADAPVVAAASPATSDDDTDTPSDPLPPDLDQVGIETGLGGVWYLVNLLVDLWLDDADAEPADAWRVLRKLAAALLDGEPPDPVWSIFDYLIGHVATEALPTSTAVGRDVGAQRSGGGVFLLHRSRAWLADSGFPPDDVPGLLRRPARLFVTRTHIDLIFRLDQIDLRARLAGLDRDPGWVPALGHVISFQYR